jgi:hypothetical protein
VSALKPLIDAARPLPDGCLPREYVSPGLVRDHLIEVLLDAAPQLDALIDAAWAFVDVWDDAPTFQPEGDFQRGLDATRAALAMVEAALGDNA